MQTSRIIFHIDINAFYAACELINDPSLKGKPIVVAHNDVLRKSIILSPSYEARAYGIKTTMLVRDAYNLCDKIIVVEPKMDLYQKHSALFFAFLEKITTQIEAGSIDEAFLDVTLVAKKTDPIRLAQFIQSTLYNKYRLPTSIGIAPNKFLAKMASNMKKPLGITVLRKREIDKLLWPLEINKMYGVGKKTNIKLRKIGINTIGDLANFQDKILLEKIIGPTFSKTLTDWANGIADDFVDPTKYDEISSISNSHTFDHDQIDVIFIKKSLKSLVYTVANRLIKKDLKAKTIGITIKYSDFHTISRSQSLNNPINEALEINEIVMELFEENYEENSLVRLVGVFVNRLSDASKTEDYKQLSIFDNLSVAEKENEIKNILNNVQTRFGDDIIQKGYYGYKKEKEKK
ncbi:MAG: DNA polymerase IV [Bacilli bacterium]|jgi:DNA polymerase-4|nr:DNA polymerase IV [Bacilli bacterium]MDD2682443.1 DNA polymerase IV [Bacilli bacterium]MDD3121620.1 DNA polymerase IV [Bacilli bacterium]MDD4062979.1 DNA polymerase IV [Bacilli bacterium]MDD4482337.1 DNA polymerase IV [Bacilli bacterium]